MTQPLRGRAREREISGLRRRAAPRRSRMHSVPASAEAASPCLDDEQILTLLNPRAGARVDPGAEAHLNACPECRDLVLVSCASLDDTAPVLSPACRFCLMFEPGCVVAERYCIRRLIGRGGMGEVFEALDLRRRESVALKTVRANASDAPAALARLLTEARLNRRVQHPNVCRGLDLGQHGSNGAAAGGTPFYTMQLVEGETLCTRLRRARLAIGEALQLGRQALSGLAAIHEAQIVHRDLKSTNLMLSTSGAQLQVTIVDFGLARPLSAAGEDAAGAAHDGSGSLAYMAPEQASGARVGPAADVFSLGVVLFEAITGQRPQLCGALPRLRDSTPDAPPWLDTFVARCLEPESARRFADGGEAARHFGVTPC
jgi:hypothetical protein